MIKTSRILSLILTLIIASASWTGANAQYWEALAENSTAHVGGIYYFLFEDEDKLGNIVRTAVVTNQYYNEDENGANSYSGAVIIPEQIEAYGEVFPVIGIMGKAFFGCTNLISVEIPKTVTTIGSQAFDGSDKLEGINVNPQNGNYYAKDGILYNKRQTELIFCTRTFSGKFEVSGDITKIHDFAFNNCKNITEVVLPNSLKEIGNAAFMNCTGMKSINIPTKLTVLGNNAFRGASSLTSSITLPASITTINSNAFRGCSKIPNVTIPEGIISIGDYAFRDCALINSIELPSTITNIGIYAFASTGLTSINIPDGITTIPSSAFAKCKLTSITLPEGLHTIKSSAFANNGTTIESVSIPESVTLIEDNAFNGTNVSNFYINNIPSRIAIGATTPFVKSDTKIHVFTKMKTIFENATNWSKYAGCFVEDIEITHVSSITLDNETMTVLATKPGKLNATINPENARVKDVVFTSSNENFILITNPATGDFVAGANEGKATITCTAADGSGVFATCEIDVKKSFSPATSVYISETELSMDNGDAKTLTARVNSGATFTGIIWVSDNEDVATVEATGEKGKAKVTAKNPGEATITAISEDGAARAKCTVTVNYNKLTLADGTPYEINETLPVKQLTYSRTFNNTSWQPLYVPFRMSYEDWSDQFEVARLLNIHSYDTTNDGKIDKLDIEVAYVKAGTTLKENHPYLIKAKTTGAKTITIANATIYPAESNTLQCASTEYTYDFTGVYEVTGNLNNGGYIMKGGLFGRATATATINPYRFYMKVTAKDGQFVDNINQAKIVVVDDFGIEETTAINSIESNESNITAVYNANGIKQTSTKQGLNIVKMADGTTKKIFVK